MPDHPPLASLIDLTGKVALVTGAAQGFGFAIAMRLAEAGARMHMLDRNAEALQAAHARLDAAGHAAEMHTADVTDPESIARVMQEITARHGGLDILVNNAGVFSNYLITQMPLEEFLRIMRVNVAGTFLCTKLAASTMIEQGRGGTIVNISSIDAVHPSDAGLSHYTASKHAIWGFTKTAALELAEHHIRVNAIAPGPSLTEGALAFVEEGAPDGIDVRAQWAGLAARAPMRRLCEPDEVGRVAVFLASELASHLTGAQIVVDGGRLLA